MVGLCLCVCVWRGGGGSGTSGEGDKRVRSNHRVIRVAASGTLRRQTVTAGNRLHASIKYTAVTSPTTCGTAQMPQPPLPRLFADVCLQPAQLHFLLQQLKDLARPGRNGRREAGHEQYNKQQLHCELVLLVSSFPHILTLNPVWMSAMASKHSARPYCY